MSSHMSSAQNTLTDGALLDVASLFPDPKMFASQSTWRAAGFDVLERNEDQIMIGSHPALSHFMFKKYPNTAAPVTQLENYRLRADGAAALRSFIAEKKLTRIVAPQKWIRELVCAPGTHVLVVEKIPVLSSRDSKLAYRRIGEQTLRELCVLTSQFCGLDSGVRNMLMTHDDKVAFIDTERWKDRHKKEKPLKHIQELLTKEQRALVKTVFKLH